MKVIYGIGQIKRRIQNTVVAIGVFDGMHRGHQHVIAQMVDRAKALGAMSVVITFFPHPVRVLHPEIQLPYLISLRHRLQLIEELGVDVCLVVHFTKRFSALSPEAFVQQYLVSRLGVTEVFVGDDFRFGQNRSGGLELFIEIAQRYNFHVNVIDEVYLGRRAIHSRCLRELIACGKLSQAEKLLGRRCSILGTVIKGDGRGKSLGFATANIQFESDIIPPLGVYIVEVLLENKSYQGIANIGRRPSFHQKNQRVHLEVHILNFKKNIYGKEVIVEFIKKIRNEKKFSSPPELVRQIKRDEQSAQKYFKQLS